MRWSGEQSFRSGASNLQSAFSAERIAEFRVFLGENTMKQKISIAFVTLICGAGLALHAQPSMSATKRKACDVAREYIRITDEGKYDRIGDLWADDAVFHAPTGEVIRGKPAISQFYSSFLRKITPVNRIGRLTYDPKQNICVLEIESRVIVSEQGLWKPDPSGNFERTAIDVFVVNKQGKVQDMRVYLGPQPKARR